MSNMMNRSRFSGNVSEASSHVVPVPDLTGLFGIISVASASVGRTKNFCYVRFLPASPEDIVREFVRASNPTFKKMTPDGTVEMVFALETPKGQLLSRGNWQGAAVDCRIRGATAALPASRSYPPVWVPAVVAGGVNPPQGPGAGR